MATNKFIAQLQDLIPFVPDGYKYRVDVFKNRKGSPVVIHDKARIIEGDEEDIEIDKMELKKSGDTIQEIPSSNIYRQKYFSWEFLKWKWQDYFLLYEGTNGKYTPLNIDNSEKVVKASEDQKQWDQFEKYQSKNTFESWKQDSKLKKWLPYMVLIIVIIGQIIMMKQQSTTLQEQGDRIIKNLGEASKNIIWLGGLKLNQWKNQREQ